MKRILGHDSACFVRYLMAVLDNLEKESEDLRSHICGIKKHQRFFRTKTPLFPIRPYHSLLPPCSVLAIAGGGDTSAPPE